MKRMRPRESPHFRVTRTGAKPSLSFANLIILDYASSSPRSSAVQSPGFRVPVARNLRREL